MKWLLKFFRKTLMVLILEGLRLANEKLKLNISDFDLMRIRDLIIKVIYGEK